MMIQVAVLGSNGMLGREFSRQKPDGIGITELNRKPFAEFEKNSHFQLTHELSNIESFLETNKVDYVINCAGLIRQKINENVRSSRISAVQSNLQLPLNLLRLSEKYNFKILQIGTDCVFSGRKGNYLEVNKHDAKDLYGRSKSAGEIDHANLRILRASIIGIEKNSSSSLLSWLLSQDLNAEVRGYTDQLWNGVTVFHFARIAYAAIASEAIEKDFHVQHLIPKDVVSKSKLLEFSSIHFGRTDIIVNPFASGSPLDMSLGTINPEFNQLLWESAGYHEVLSINEMIAEYATSLHIKELA
jgi:dTDP-4-dehydrorhamnose reductase